MSVTLIIPDDYGEFISGLSKVKEKVLINNKIFMWTEGD